eukprot:7212832-Pyramimonas_sp.AAC.1
MVLRGCWAVPLPLIGPPLQLCCHQGVSLRCVVFVFSPSLLAKPIRVENGTSESWPQTGGIVIPTRD